MRLRRLALLALAGMAFWFGCAKPAANGNVKRNADKAFEHLEQEKGNNGR